MAVPKKKISPSRRDQRRYSARNVMKTPTWVLSPINSEVVRPHRVTMETLSAYLEQRDQRKQQRSKAAR